MRAYIILAAFAALALIAIAQTIPMTTSEPVCPLPPIRMMIVTITEGARIRNSPDHGHLRFGGSRCRFEPHWCLGTLRFIDHAFQNSL